MVVKRKESNSAGATHGDTRSQAEVASTTLRVIRQGEKYNIGYYHHFLKPVLHYSECHGDNIGRFLN